MKNNKNKKSGIHKKLLLVLAILFAFMGLGKIWLWTKDASNDFGLYLGLGFCLLSISNFIVFKRLKK